MLRHNLVKSLRLHKNFDCNGAKQLPKTQIKLFVRYNNKIAWWVNFVTFRAVNKFFDMVQTRVSALCACM